MATNEFAPCPACGSTSRCNSACPYGEMFNDLRAVSVNKITGPDGRRYVCEEDALKASIMFTRLTMAANMQHPALPIILDAMGQMIASALNFDEHSDELMERIREEATNRNAVASLSTFTAADIPDTIPEDWA